MKTFWSAVVAFFTKGLRKAQEVGEEVCERYDLEEWPEVERECYVFRYPARKREGSLMKSKGHILFFDVYEYFRRDGHIYKAIKFDPIQIDGYRPAIAKKEEK